MKKILSIVALVIFFTTISVSGFAYGQGSGGQNVPPGGSGTNVAPIPSLTNPIKANNVEEALLSAVDVAIFIGTIMAVLMFIFIGFKFVMAQGNDSKLKEAKDWFLYAAIGTAVLISSKVIVEVIKSTFVSTGVVNESLFKKQ